MTSTLQASLIILKRISNQLQNVKGALHFVVERKMNLYKGAYSYEEVFHLNTCQYGLVHYSFVNYVSFLDEYNDYFRSNDAAEKNKIIAVKKVCKKHIANLKSIFGDIKEARNTVLAHGYRDGKHCPLSNQQINDAYNRLVLHDDGIESFALIAETTALIMAEIEKVFGGLSDKEIAL